jgi:hypothetical protein
MVVGWTEIRGRRREGDGGGGWCLPSLLYLFVWGCLCFVFVEAAVGARRRLVGTRRNHLPGLVTLGLAGPPHSSTARLFF